MLTYMSARVCRPMPAHAGSGILVNLMPINWYVGQLMPGLDPTGGHPPDRHYLMGKHYDVYTDHKSMKYIFTQRS
jgi:hypothetical protein